jgi:hypothetical protein
MMDQNRPKTKDAFESLCQGKLWKQRRELHKRETKEEKVLRERRRKRRGARR